MTNKMLYVLAFITTGCSYSMQNQIDPLKKESLKKSLAQTAERIRRFNLQKLEDKTL